MKNPHDIILRPVLTEKGYDGIADKRYVFEVAIDANKVEIKDADGNVKEIDGNGVIPIVRNLKIKFNENTIGEIR